MATITEDYVSFETSKLLKEKEFPSTSICMYDENGNIQWGCYRTDWYAIVTLQMAMKWLREVHNYVLNLIEQLVVISIQYPLFLMEVVNVIQKRVVMMKIVVSGQLTKVFVKQQ